VILILVEGLISLHNQIKQDTHTLNMTSIQYLERYIRKLINTAQIFFAKNTFFYNQNQILIRINNKTKIRRSTKLIVLGKTKIINFEDIEVARVAYAAKEVIKGKRKHNRKRKNTALELDKLEPDELEPEPEITRATKEIIKGRGKHGRKHKSTTQEADKLEPEITRMIGALVL
jgi:hypothetical protein